MKYLIILLLSLSFTGCGNNRQPGPEAVREPEISKEQLSLSDEQLKALPINTVSLEKKKIPSVLQLSGKVDVDPDYRLSLSSALGGHVKSVNALPGKPVKKGEAILVLEDNQFIQIQQDYLTTKARLYSSEADYFRQKDLNASKSASDKALQLAETEYRTLLTAKRALEEKLRLINIDPASLTADNIKRSISIAAPFNGLISRIMVNKGRYVSPSDVLVELINPEGLLLNVKVFEKDWPRLSVGQQLEAFTNQYPQRKIQARIITVGSEINDDGTAEIIAKIVQPNSVKLVAGLYVNVELNTGDEEAYALPEEAVVSFEGRHYVFEYVTPNSFRAVEVSPGKTQDGETVMTGYEALAGKKFVGKGAYALLMALKNTSEE